MEAKGLLNTVSENMKLSKFKYLFKTNKQLKQPHYTAVPCEGEGGGVQAKGAKFILST